jgi:hypothetical protein
VLCPACPTKGALQAHIRLQTLVGLDQLVCTAQQTDEGIQQLFTWSILHCLLRNLDCLWNRFEHSQLSHLSAQPHQGSVTRKIRFDIFADNDGLVHGDGPPVSECGDFSTGTPITALFPQGRSWHAASILGGSISWSDDFVEFCVLSIKSGRPIQRAMRTKVFINALLALDAEDQLFQLALEDISMDTRLEILDLLVSWGLVDMCWQVMHQINWDRQKLFSAQVV